MTHGRWNGPARQQHQTHVLSELQKNMARDLVKLRASGFEKALGEVAQHKQRRLDSANIAGQFMFK
jgi:hypothetical protein